MTNALKDIHVFESRGYKIAFNGNTYDIVLLDDTGLKVLSKHIAGKELIGQEVALSEKICNSLVTSSSPVKSKIPASIEKISFSSNTMNISSLCLNITSHCNLKCDYCFNHQGSYSFVSHQVMNENTARNAIKFLLSHSEKKHYVISFFGGEPLTQFQLIKKTVEYAKEQTKNSGVTFSFNITTNGVLITKEIAQFLKEHHFSVIISLDGDESIHNDHRRFPNNIGSYQAALHGAKTVIKEYDSQEKVAIRGTYTTQNISSFDKAFIHLINNGFKCISIEPASGDTKNKYTIKLTDIPVLVEKYRNIADIFENVHKTKHISFFHFINIIQNLAQFNRHTRPCGPANGYMAVAPNGDIYPCHRIMGIEYRIGNVNSIVSGETLDITIREKFRNATTENRPKCRKCWARNLCGGGCYAHSIDNGQDILEPCAVDCELFKLRAELSIGLFVKEELVISGKNDSRFLEHEHSQILRRKLISKSVIVDNNTNCEDDCESSCTTNYEDDCPRSCTVTCGGVSCMAHSW